MCKSGWLDVSLVFVSGEALGEYLAAARCTLFMNLF